MCVVTGYFALCTTERIQFKGKCNWSSRIRNYVTFCGYCQFMLYYYYYYLLSPLFFIVICIFLWIWFTSFCATDCRIM